MTVLFMPDISGFTTFVKEVELRHSKHIISEILNLLIQTNKNRFQLAEIEGDALFYFQSEVKINTELLLEEIQEMHQHFHEHLNLYRYKRVCNCGACTTASDLKIKFIVHIGETEIIELNNTKKPFGPAVIEIHRLLKNKVTAEEYILFSHSYWSKYSSKIKSLFGTDFKTNIEKYDLGEISYHSYPLSFKSTPENKNNFPQLKGLKPISVSKFVRAETNELFQFIVDLNKRTLWNPGLDSITAEKELNEINSYHTCVINGKDVNIKTVFANTTEDHLTYIEETKDVPFMESLITVFTVTESELGSTLKVEAFLKHKSFLGLVFKPIFKNKLKTNLVNSFNKLDEIFN